VKGITDSHALLRGERLMVIEPDGDQGWCLRTAAANDRAASPVEVEA
jgi:hypothetical protein